MAVLEGFHALKHAIRFGADLLDVRTVDPEGVLDLAREHATDLVPDLDGRFTAVDAGTFEALAPSPHPTGVIALAHRTAVDVERLLAPSGPDRAEGPDRAGGTAAVVYLEEPSHHGNIGAAVRVAAAAGAAGVLVSGIHDPWHPSSIRGAAGLQFALPVARVDALPETGRPIVALDPEGAPLWGGSETVVTVPRDAVLVFGTERHGVSAGLLRRADLWVAIPMRPGVSSLNLATSVAVTLYAVLHAT